MKARNAIAAMAASAMLLPATAQALPTRIWVAVSGSDTAGCGPATNPCRSFQYAHDNIAPSGEIDVAAPGGYGQVTITKAISIINDGVGAATIQAASGNGITINAGTSDAVFLRGLSIDGAGTGANGIVFNSGGSLTVADSTIRKLYHNGDFHTGNGIMIQPAEGTVRVNVTRTTIADNGWVGLYFIPPSGSSASIAFSVDGLTGTGNRWAFAANEAVAPTVPIKGVLSDSTLSHSSNAGAFFEGGAINTTMSNVRLSNNPHGIEVYSNASVTLDDSVVANNAVGVYLNSPTARSFGNNAFVNNTIDVSGGTLASVASK